MATATPQVRIIFDRRKRATATVKGTVEIEVVSNGDRLRLSTGVSVLRQQWKGGYVINHVKADELNHQIHEMYDDIFERLTTMVKAGVIDINMLKGSRKRAVEESNDFLSWLEKRIMLRGVTESTHRQHLVMHRCLKEFGLIRCFEDLNTRNIKLWDDYIRTKVTAQSSVHGYHKRLKPYIVEAIQLNLITYNPYETIRIPRGRSEGIKFLSEEERDRIASLECFGPVEKVRDMFIFACYTGLSYADLVKIRKEDVIKQGDDYCIKDKRLKTFVATPCENIPNSTS